jgi:mRNA interferase MazF
LMAKISTNMKQNEIWLVSLEPTIGAELRKTRPCIIVNDDAVGVLALKIIVPITDWKNQYNNTPWMVNLAPNVSNGLQKESAADCFRVRSLSQNRFIRKIGKLTFDEFKEIKLALSTVFSLFEA